jgi:hypothetical protein
MGRPRHGAEGILLIFDNATNPDALKTYLPGGGAAHVLVTRRLLEGQRRWQDNGVDGVRMLVHPPDAVLMVDVSREARQRRREDGLYLRRLVVGVLALAALAYDSRPEELALRTLEADAER